MQMPKAVWVDGVQYTVGGMPRDEKHEGLNGIIYFEEEGQRILVNSNLSDRQKALTLLHEVIHAALHPLRLRREEEKIVLRLESGLANAFESNPGLFRDLIKTLRGTRSRKT